MKHTPRGPAWPPDGLAEEIERLRAEPAEGDIAIGGAALAADLNQHRRTHACLLSKPCPV
ncbi:hypothetical protein [Streptomyces sp. 6N106]|uniref:hypothetical protein n=1 Tax=Streptomyces sp. 6N106 TaxID=3457418 RepID=UPI003FCFEDF0